jgi:RNA polymerase sigma-70 factor (ECF subfamily)
LFTIAHRRAVDALRRRRHRSVDLDSVREPSGQDGRELADRFADAAVVRAAVAQLPHHERVVVEMSYFDDLSQREVAERLDVLLGTVKARASRGIRRLRVIIRDAERTWSDREHSGPWGPTGTAYRSAHPAPGPAAAGVPTSRRRRRRQRRP